MSDVNNIKELESLKKMESPNIDEIPTIYDIDLDDYDFIDFGTSMGASLDFCAIKFGGNGLGIDINEYKVARYGEKVKKSVTGNHNIVLGDILDLNAENFLKKFKFTSCIHFLEHIDGYYACRDIVQTAVNISTDFVLIVQPYSDKDVELFKKGFKMCYSHWGDHTNLLTSYDFFKLCCSLESVNDFVIYARTPVENSSHSQVHSIHSPINQNDYDENKHPKKEENVPFEGVYKEIGVLIILNDDLPVDKILNDELDIDIYMKRNYNKVLNKKIIIYDSRKD